MQTENLRDFLEWSFAISLLHSLAASEDIEG